MQNDKLLQQRLKRKARIRAKVTGTSETPRLTVFKSNLAIYAQLIDDKKGVTLASASSIKNKEKGIEAAKKVGVELAKLAKEKKITACAFDRNSYKYHGAIKALADACREAGLKF